MSGGLLFGHHSKTAYNHYLETKEQERRDGNEKRSKYMQEQLGLNNPQEYRVLDPSLQVENVKASTLESVEHEEVAQKLAKLKYNPLFTERRNDELAIHFTAAVISSIDPESSRAFTNIHYFPKQGQR